MSNTQDPIARQTPLVDLLAAVPADARLVIEQSDGKGTHFIPIGRLCQEAIAALQSPAPQPQGFDAHDMATAAADGFRDGVASVQPPGDAREAPHLFELWWAEYMPEATQARAWQAWVAAPRSDGVGVVASERDLANVAFQASQNVLDRIAALEAENARLRAATAQASEPSTEVDLSPEGMTPLDGLTYIMDDYQRTFGRTPDTFMAEIVAKTKERLFIWWSTHREVISAALAAPRAVEPLTDGQRAAIHDLRELHKQTTPGEWGKGRTTHHTVSRRAGQQPYHIAEFRHADDAAFLDVAHKYVPVLVDLLEAHGITTTPAAKEQS